MSNDDDQLQLSRCKTGDQAAFAVLVNRYHRPLYNAAFRVLGNAEDANDITQVVFLKIAERIDEYDPTYKFFSWIYRIAINESLNLLRNHQREVALDDDVEIADADHMNPEARYHRTEVREHVQQALMRLKLDDRVVITLRHFSEFSYREIADILDLEEKTVKSRLFEARQRLGVLLTDLNTH